MTDLDQSVQEENSFLGSLFAKCTTREKKEHVKFNLQKLSCSLGFRGDFWFHWGSGFEELAGSHAE